MADTRVRVKSWVILAMVLALAFVGAGFVLNRYFERERIAELSARLQLLSTLRRDALRDYVDTVRAEITFWSMNADLVAKHVDLAQSWPSKRRNDGSTYDRLHDRLHPLARQFVVERGYYDFFLIDLDGNVIYSVEKEQDYETNLFDGPWRDTGLAYVFRHALADAGQDTVSFSDFWRYAPSNDAPAMFAARALGDARGQVHGVLAMQLPTDRIQEIMQFTAGMGETGETYLVGNDLLMRSNSRFSRESTILHTQVDTETVRRALKGETGVEFAEDYRGVRVLSAYTFADIDHIRWAVMAEMDEEEVVRDPDGERSLFAGLLSLVYALILASAWFVTSGAWGAGGGASAPFEPDLADLSD